MSGSGFRNFGEFLKVLGRLKLRHRKFQTAFAGFFGFENKKDLNNQVSHFIFTR